MYFQPKYQKDPVHVFTQNITISVFLDTELCPVTSFKFYVSKLDKRTNFLWQKPKQGRIHYTDETWYEKNRVGEDLLNRYMKFLQKNVTLDGTYTNHSIRSTVITKLDFEGFEARHIMQLSSHKNESTIKEYSVKCSDNKRKEMFDSLSNAMTPKFKKIKPKPPASATTSVRPLSNDKEQIQNKETNKRPDVPELQDIKENLPNFDLQQIDSYDTIDDTVLQDLLNDEFTEPNLQVANQNPVPNAPNPTINSQVNNFTMPNPSPNWPRFPQMYFPNSNVTINYNFPK